jgi:hypothetical protein
MLFNERKKETLEYFSRRRWVRPPSWSRDRGVYPIRRGYTYLKKLHKWGLLHRGHDVRGLLVYRLSPRGASWLLRNRALSM